MQPANIFLATFPSCLLSIIMIFNVGEETDVTLAALVFFGGSGADRQSGGLVMTALSELNIHTWPGQ